MSKEPSKYRGQEEVVDKTVRRVLWNIFKGGVYDKVGDGMAWAELADGAKIGSQEHDEMNYEMALQVIRQLRSLRFQEACFEPELLSLRPALRPASSLSGGLLTSVVAALLPCSRISC